MKKFYMCYYKVVKIFISLNKIQLKKCHILETFFSYIYFLHLKEIFPGQMEPVAKRLKLKDFCLPKVLYRNRYCNQEDFSTLVWGSKDPKNYKSYKYPVLEENLPSFEVTSRQLVDC